MAQHDYNIANQSGAAFRADLNNALLAIVSQNSGTSAPSTTFAHQLWADTTTSTLKIRNAANSAWIELMQLDGTLTMEDGTALLPGLAFRDDLNTGLFSDAADTLGITTNGVERVEFGTSEVVFNDGGNDVDFRIEGDTNANLFFVDAGNDRIGVGTSSPGSLLQVGTGALSSNNVAAFLGGSTTFENATTGSGPSITFNNDTDTGILNPSANTLGINTGGTRAITITDVQRVGIGTTSFAVGRVGILANTNAEALSLISRPSDDQCELHFRNSADDATLARISTSGGQNFAVRTGASEAFRVDSSQRLLVGTSTAPTDTNNGAHYSKLTSVGNTYSATGDGRLALCTGTSVASLASGSAIGGIYFGDNAGAGFASISASVDATPGTSDYPGRLVFSTTADGASSPTTRMTIKNGGQVLIGATDNFYGGTAVDGFQFQGSGSLIFGHAGTTAQNACIFYNGNGVVGTINYSGSSTSYNTSSDYRLKENVVDLDGAITRVKQLAPKRFNFIADDTDAVVDGFLAHEAQTVVPEAVTGTHNEVDDEGSPVYQGIDQSKLVPLLTAALQEAIAKIETLEAKVAALESA